MPPCPHEICEHVGRFALAWCWLAWAPDPPSVRRGSSRPIVAWFVARAQDAPKDTIETRTATSWPPPFDRERSPRLSYAPAVVPPREDFGGAVCFLFDTEGCGMHEVRCRTASLGRLLRSKIRYWVILQLIPLIALCCVLQRNGKPSHPSRHVVEAVLHAPPEGHMREEARRSEHAERALSPCAVVGLALVSSPS